MKLDLKDIFNILALLRTCVMSSLIYELYVLRIRVYFIGA